MSLEQEWSRYLKSQRVRLHGVPAVREVYCIGEAGTGLPVKVGLAKDVNARLAILQSHNWRKLTIYWSLPGLPFHEQRLHQALSSRRLTSEWFEDADDLIKAAPICGGTVAETERLIGWLVQRTHSEVSDAR